MAEEAFVERCPKQRPSTVSCNLSSIMEAVLLPGREVRPRFSDAPGLHYTIAERSRRLVSLVLATVVSSKGYERLIQRFLKTNGPTR